jgi:hypothetical protein
VVGATQQGVIEISVGGQWVKVPAMAVVEDGKVIVVRGKLLRIASVNDEDWLETDLRAPEAVVDRLTKRPAESVRADVFTFKQMLPETTPRYQYRCESESLAAVRTDNFEAWWIGLPQETRKNVRRSAKRGVTVAIKPFDDEMVAGIVNINNSSPLRQGKPNTHFGKSFDEVKRDYSSFLERSDFICAHAAGELIGILKLVYRGRIASILQCLPNPIHADKRPANALIARAVELCQQKGLSYMTYGFYRYGNKTSSPLLDFKVRNGFEEVLVPKFVVPLTAWGSACVAMGLHRGMMSLLPGALINRVSAARSKWYEARYRKAAAEQQEATG